MLIPTRHLKATIGLVVFLVLPQLGLKAEVIKGVGTVGGLILAEDKPSEHLATQLNFALTKLGETAARSQSNFGPWRHLELRFDAGNLRKRDSGRAKSHLNQTFRRLNKGDFQEAAEQLFRAKRFIFKTFPFSMDQALFAEILYYQSIVNEKLGKAKLAKEDYCTYLYAMSNLSRSSVPLDQKVQNLKSCVPSDETGELVLSTSGDGGVVFIDGAPQGVVSPSIPYTAPYLSVGLHFVEVRRPGKARWGEVVDISPRKSIKRKVRLKSARSGVNDVELDPFSSLVFFGSEASGGAFVQEIMYQYAQRVGLNTLLLGKVITVPTGGWQLMLAGFHAGEVRTAILDVTPETFDFEKLMLKALRSVGLEIKAVAELAPNSNPDYLFFKVR